MEPERGTIRNLMVETSQVFFLIKTELIHLCNSQNFMLTVETHSFKVTTSSVQRCFEIFLKIRCHAERQCQRTFGFLKR